MSMHAYNYVGIYFECEKQYEIKENKIPICNKCKIVIDGLNFCSSCGNNLKINKEYKIVKEKQEKYFTEILIEELDEEIIEIDFYENKERKYYILNTFDEKYCYNVDEEGIIELGNINVKNIIEQYKIKHFKIIGFFEKYYKEKYKIKFGYINYYM